MREGRREEGRKKKVEYERKKDCGKAKMPRPGFKHKISHLVDQSYQGCQFQGNNLGEKYKRRRKIAVEKKEEKLPEKRKGWRRNGGGNVHMHAEAQIAHNTLTPPYL